MCILFLNFLEIFYIWLHETEYMSYTKFENTFSIINLWKPYYFRMHIRVIHAFMFYYLNQKKFAGRNRWDPLKSNYHLFYLMHVSKKSKNVSKTRIPRWNESNRSKQNLISIIILHLMHPWMDFNNGELVNV